VDVRQVDIGCRVSGKVAKLFFEEGDLVPSGSLLAILDKSPYDSLAQEAAAHVDAVRASFINAEILFNRRLELLENGGVSQEDVNNAQASRDEWQATLLEAQSALQVALDNLSFTDIFAPNEGIILTRIKEPGSIIKESDPIYTLSLTTPVWVRAFVDEQDLGLVKYGMDAEVFTDTPRGKSYKGKVGFISPVAEFTPKTVETTQLRTDLVYRLRIYIDHPDQGLKQGMPVTVKLPL